MRPGSEINVMAEEGDPPDGGEGATLTPRQKKWFASVREGLERDTGKTLAEWAHIARSCPETTQRRRAAWLKAEHGLGQNRAAAVLRAAFPDARGWDEPGHLLDALWSDQRARAVYDAVAARVRADISGAVIGPRKTFVGFSRVVQFAAIIPAAGGRAELGLPLATTASARLAPVKKRPWAERHISMMTLTAPSEVDTEVTRLLKLSAQGR
jgi:hypothetical protein